eukprot:TRINITY_DN6541_c0_g3_i2.p2 TRINITY_DN6541_c0_g3~~TRINITY_DN6541_c0_g3_i2.p2  ORF type:complete len:155 (+),score=14.41 TRINITY_DN6541_c0_g3_i2:399-863(+)
MLLNFLSLFQMFYFFIKLACFLRNIWAQLDILMKQSKDCDEVQKTIHESQNILNYMNNMMEYSPEIAEILCNCLLYYSIFPALMPCFFEHREPHYFHIFNSMFLLCQICKTLKYPPLISAITTILFLPHIPCTCLLYTSPSPRDLSTSRMPSSA